MSQTNTSSYPLATCAPGRVWSGRIDSVKPMTGPLAGPISFERAPRYGTGATEYFVFLQTGPLVGPFSWLRRRQRYRPCYAALSSKPDCRRGFCWVPPRPRTSGSIRSTEFPGTSPASQTATGRILSSHCGPKKKPRRRAGLNRDCHGTS
jgi:hypothetical protein